MKPQSFVLTNEEWAYSYHTGRGTGFTYFLNKDIATKKLIELKNINSKCGFGKSFHIEYIDIDFLPLGKLVIEKIQK